MVDPFAGPFGVVAKDESSFGRNLYNPIPTSSGHAEGLYGITTGTWNEFATPSIKERWPTPNDAPWGVQTAVAAQIPLKRWAPSTVAHVLEYLGYHPALASRANQLVLDAPGAIKDDLGQALRANRQQDKDGGLAIGWDAASPDSWQYLQNRASSYGLGFPSKEKPRKMMVAESAATPETVVGATASKRPVALPQMSLTKLRPLRVRASARMPDNLLTTALGKILARGRA